MSATYTKHAAERIAARLTPAEADLVRARCDQAAAEHPRGRGAVRVLRLDQRGVAWDETSNGDRVVALMLDGSVLTVELRRSSQPWNRGALRTDWLDIYDI